MIMDMLKRQNGFTLVEVLVAIVVLTIGLLGAAFMQIKSVSGNASAIRTTRAATWAENSIETLATLPYDHADLTESINTPGAAGLDCTAPTRAPALCLADHGPIAQGDFTLYWNVANDYPIFGCKTIRVIVHRNDSELWRPDVTLDYIKMGPI